MTSSIMFFSYSWYLFNRSIFINYWSKILKILTHWHFLTTKSYSHFIFISTFTKLTFNVLFRALLNWKSYSTVSCQISNLAFNTMSSFIHQCYVCKIIHKPKKILLESIQCILPSLVQVWYGLDVNLWYKPLEIGNSLVILLLNLTLITVFSCISLIDFIRTQFIFQNPLHKPLQIPYLSLG